MNILTITEGYPPETSGGATYAYEIPRRMTKYKTKTLVITKKSDVPYEDEKSPYVFIHRIDFPKYKKEGFSINFQRFKFILKLLKTTMNRIDDYDIIHLHSGFGAKIIAWSLKNVYRVKKPIVMTFHGTFIGNYKMFYPFPIYNIFDAVSKKLIIESNCDKYIIVDDGTHAERVLKGAINGDKIVKHHHAVDCSTFKPQKIKKKGRIISFIGRLDPFKGIDIFIKAIPEIYKKHNDLKFLFVGDGPIRKDLELLVKKLEIESIVEFVGPVTHSKIPYYINLSDCMVFNDIRAFENREYLNLAMCEAMACGSLFLSSSYPRKEWKHPTWISVETPKPKETAEKLSDILENPKKYVKIRKNARKVALKFFNWDKIIKLYYNEFSKLETIK